MPLTYTPIATQTLGSSASSVTFTSIPATYTDLIIVLAGTSSANISYKLQFNGDTGSNYSNTFLYGDGSSAISGRSSSQTSIGGMGRTGTSQGNGVIQVMNYSNTTTNKTTIGRGSLASQLVISTVGLWRSTSAITSINLAPESGTIDAGSTFSLYGIASTAASAKATGGNIITTDGTYWYHAFTASGTFTPASTLSCDVLVVAGGGGGGRTVGGGGGAGGLLGFTGQSVSTAQTITIGAGGAGGTSFTGTGTTGSDSQFGSLTLVKGGGGAGGGDGINGLTGGSGGGGGGAAQGQGGAGTSGQGFAGFTWGGSGLQIGGGGGGSSAAATNKNGANGVTTYSSWGIATGTGQNVSGTVYYAGGGGAGTNSGAGGGATVAGTGGFGGGASGRVLASAGVPTAATANTGGGGGGSGGNGDSSNGGAGGSGLVIVRYPV